MKRAIFATAAILLFSGAAYADDWSSKFKALDTDGSGSISRTEWEANVATLKLDPAPTFTAMDQDVNNSVDTDEWTQAEKMAKAFPVSCKSSKEFLGAPNSTEFRIVERRPEPGATSGFRACIEMCGAPLRDFSDGAVCTEVASHPAQPQASRTYHPAKSTACCDPVTSARTTAVAIRMANLATGSTSYADRVSRRRVTQAEHCRRSQTIERGPIY